MGVLVKENYKGKQQATNACANSLSNPRQGLFRRILTVCAVALFISFSLLHTGLCPACVARYINSAVYPHDYKADYTDLVARKAVVPRSVVAALVPFTSKDRKVDPDQPLLGQLALFKTLLPSMFRSMRCDGALSYILYLGVANDDVKLHDKNEEIKGMAMGVLKEVRGERCDVAVQIVKHDVHDGNLCRTLNVLSRKMYKERRADYGIVLDEDVVVRGDWVEAFVKTLSGSSARRNLGIVASEESHTRLLRTHTPQYAFFHKTHLKIFDGDFCDESLVRGEGVYDILCGAYRAHSGTCTILNDFQLEWTDRASGRRAMSQRFAADPLIRGPHGQSLLGRAIAQGIARGVTRITLHEENKPMREPYIVE